MHTTLHTLSFALVSHPLQHNPTLLILHHANTRHFTAPSTTMSTTANRPASPPPNSAVQSPFHKLEGSEKSYRDTWIVSKMVSLDDVVAAG